MQKEQLDILERLIVNILSQKSDKRVELCLTRKNDCNNSVSYIRNDEVDLKEVACMAYANPALSV